LFTKLIERNVHIICAYKNQFFSLNGISVTFADQVKYLSVLLYTLLINENDMQRQVKSLYCAADKLGGTFAQCSNAVRNIMFCANACLPIVEHVNPI